MDLKFPLPPIGTPSSRFQTVSSDVSSISSYHSATSHERGSSSTSDHDLISSDSACIHPVFINSDLRPKTGMFSIEEKYPVDRLNPVCMGYFNHIEYEAAMASINAIEAMVRDRSPPSDVNSLSEVSDDTLQHRRSASKSLSWMRVNYRTRLVVAMGKPDGEFVGKC